MKFLLDVNTSGSLADWFQQCCYPQLLRPNM